MPQYRWREMPQSFSRNCTVRVPMPRASAAVAICGMASVDQSPVKSPESTTRPGSTYASVIVSGVRAAAPSGWMTTVTGRLYLRANSKSRWS